MSYTPQTMSRTEADQWLREAAYLAWSNAGRPSGQDLRFWTEAQAQFQDSRIYVRS